MDQIQSGGKTPEEKILILEKIRDVSGKNDYDEALKKMVSTKSEQEIVRSAMDEGTDSARQRIVKSIQMKSQLEAFAKNQENLIGSDIKLEDADLTRSLQKNYGETGITVKSEDIPSSSAQEGYQGGAPSSYDDELISPFEKNAISARKGAEEIEPVLASAKAELSELEAMQSEFQNIDKRLDSRSFNDFMKYPAFKEAFESARGVIKNKGRVLSDNPEKMSVGDLDLVKRFLKDNINIKRKATGVSSAEESAVADVADKFSNWMGNKSSDWKGASQNYAKNSNKVDQVRYLKALKDALKNPSDIESATRFLNAMDNEAALMKKATGYGRYGSVDALMGKGTPLAKDVKKGTDAIEQALLDRQMVGRLQSGQSVGKNLSGGIEPPIPNWLDARATFAKSMIKRLVENKTPQYQNVASRIMTSKEEMLKVLNSTEKEIGLDFMREISKVIGLESGNQVGEQ